MTNNGNCWYKRQDRNTTKTCSIFQRSPFRFFFFEPSATQRLTETSLDNKNIPFMFSITSESGSVLWEYWGVLGGVLRDPLVTWSRPLRHYQVKGFSLHGPAPKSDQLFFFFLNATSEGPHAMSNYLVFCLLMFSFSSVDRLALTV